jgi:thiol peroxidase
MSDRTRSVTLQGNPLTLTGEVLKIGDKAPDVELIDNDLLPVRLSSFQGKICLISAVPSLDTPVCNMETRRFNQEAVAMGSDVVILTVSMDLPFAQKRWCGAAGVDGLTTLSDHRTAAFGRAYGTLIEEIRLLTRAVFVVDRDRIVRYIQFVPEVANEPDYDEILEAVRNLS